MPVPGRLSAASIGRTQPGLSRTVGLRISTASVDGSKLITALAAAANPRFARWLVTQADDPAAILGPLPGQARRSRAGPPSADSDRFTGTAG